jgi:hypothetical protein
MASSLRFWAICLLAGFAALGGPSRGLAQADSLRLDEPFWAEASIFRDQQPKQTWLRWNLAPLIDHLEPQLIRAILDLHYEQKLHPAWSVLAHYRRTVYLSWGVDPPTHRPPQAFLGVGGRYYYQMVDNIQSGRQADNLNGGYLGLILGTQLTARSKGPNRNQNHWYSNSLSLTAMFGTQRQLFRFGFSDVGFGVRVTHGTQGPVRFIYPIYINDGWQVFPVAHLRLGLGW